MKHTIDITVANNAFAVASSNDGVMGLFVQATTVSTTFVVDNAYLLTKVADLTTLGVTAVNNPAAYLQIIEFFAQAANGAKLWVFPITDTVPYVTYVASTKFAPIIRGTAVANTANRVKVIAFAYKIPSATQSATDFPADVLDSLPIIQTAIDTLFAEGYPLQAIVDGYNMKSSLTAATISTIATLVAKDCHNVSVCITGTSGLGVSSVGLLLGKIARLSVGTSVGKVADGAIEATEMYFTNGILTSTATKASALAPTDVNTLGDSQYVFARTWLGYPGYYWNDGATADALTASLNTIEANRIANKLSSDALYFFTKEIGRSLPTDAAGSLDAGYRGNKEREFYLNYIAPLKNSGDISEGSIQVTGATFQTDRTLTFKLTILPAPAVSNIVGTVEFTTTL